MKRIKINEISIHIYEKLNNFLDGTGISKLPGVLKVRRIVFTLIRPIIGKEFLREIDDDQKFYGFITKKGQYVFYSDDFEKDVTTLFISMLHENMTVADIGASTGYYTLLAAKRIGINGLVLSFEPDPERFEGLLKNITANKWKNIRPYCLAVSNSDGTREFTCDDVAGGFAIKKTSGVINVDTVTLDNFLKNNKDISIRAMVVKIDVEGGGIRCIEGDERYYESKY